jgi:rubredoxin
MFCGRATFDPDKRARPWVRGVAGERQVLVCPQCQVDRADWAGELDRCDECGSTRLSAMIGEIVCRQCGATRRNESERSETTGA